MLPLDWPPEFDGVKINRNSILVRVKDTDIWIELDINNLDSVSTGLPSNIQELIQAWRQLLRP